MNDVELRTLPSVISQVLLRAEIASDIRSCPVHLRIEILGSNKLDPLLPINVDITPIKTPVISPASDASDASHVLDTYAQSVSNSSVVLSADADIWNEIFQKNPKSGFHSIGALRRGCPGFKVIGGDLSIAQALPLAERIIDYVRLALYPQNSTSLSWDKSVLKSITGRYVCISTERDEWVYTEQAGNPSGPTILMLHTAGADSRQWHGLMGTPRVGQNTSSTDSPLQDWSMHAFDLPGHGRSPLPLGHANWNWTLTEQDYCRWIISYMDANQIERATLMGCSMGSAIGLVLLSKYPDRFDGAILLEAPYCSRGRRSVYLNHSQVHGARLAAAWVGSLLAPQSEKSARDQATWIYSQGAPGVYDGDLAFYSDDFDAHQHASKINTDKTPLWLLTGNYDYSASPDETRKIEKEVRGSNFVELQGFGHFPMIENPVGLIPYLVEPLKTIMTKARAR